jgi:ABC-type uncharacterized transport system permease subunit
MSQAALIDFLAAGLLTATPLVLAACGGCLLERAGVYALALEGMMLAGCLGAVYGAVTTGSATAGVLCGVIAGMLIAAVMAIASITLGADQIVSALAVNLLALGGTAYALGELFPGGVNAGEVPHIDTVSIPLLSNIPLAGPVLFEQSLPTYGAVGLVALTWYVLLHTRWGLGLRAVGQYPRAADTLGVSPWRMQQGALLACGACGGVAGAVLALQTAGTFTENMSGGRGFIALAAVIFGRWHPLYAGLAALLFGFADALQLRFQVLGIPVSSYFVQMIPYLMALVALVLLGGRAQYAAAIGQAYTRRNK